MNLESIVQTYIKKIRPFVQSELNWFRSQPTLNAAVKHAGLAINDKGKRYNHQRRIIRDALLQAESVLLTNLNSIKRSSNFDELYNLIDVLLRPVGGIGELYVYDTTLRISAKLNLLPSRVYLHAGTRDGAKALGFDGRRKFVEESELPLALQVLEPHEIEDMLCIFKDKLKQMKFDLTDEEILRRSRCS